MKPSETIEKRSRELIVELFEGVGIKVEDVPAQEMINAIHNASIQSIIQYLDQQWKERNDKEMEEKASNEVIEKAIEYGS